MKRFTMFITFMLLVTLSGLANASRVTIVNHSGMDIYELYVSPAGRDLWGSDLLRGRILKNSQSCSVIWNAGKRNMWDMTGKDSTGDGIIWVGIDVTDVAKITVNPVYAYCELRKQ